ncbi:hypothetical protein J6TS7_33660 [Paenibacillus dendritiformis]|nr:hypothetical protein J6TS7_33660 [Paenibacillus dendritiformis]
MAAALPERIYSVRSGFSPVRDARLFSGDYVFVESALSAASQARAGMMLRGTVRFAGLAFFVAWAGNGVRDFSIGWYTA